MRDPYEVLGVQKNATPAAIKSAFRRLAKKLHPDANKTDKAAATKFAELNAAYEIVGDESKRKAFDRGEIDAEGKPRFQGFGGGGGRRGRAVWARARGRTASSNISPGAPTASSAAAAGQAAAAASTTSSRKCSAARAGGGRRSQFEQEDFGGAAAGQRRHRHGHHHTAGGFDRDVAARASADRQGDRRQDSGRPRRRPDHPPERTGACPVPAASPATR